MKDLESKIGDYLRSELVKIRPQGKQISRFSLRHASPGHQGNDVESWDHDDKMNLDDIGVFANEIAARAQTDADGIGPGVHRYTLQSYIGKQPSSGRFVFRIRASEDPDDEIGGDDSPTTKGLLAQLMRHNEANARTLNTMSSGVVTLLVRRLEAMDSRMSNLEKERAETFLALEAAKSEQHTRDMELMKESNNEERKDAALKKLMDLAPVVVNRIAGKQLMEAKDPLSAMVSQLGDSLSQEQISKIASALSPEQQIMFVEAVKTAKERGGNVS